MNIRKLTKNSQSQEGPGRKKNLNVSFLFTKSHFIKLLQVIDNLREHVSLNLQERNLKNLQRLK